MWFIVALSKAARARIMKNPARAPFAGAVLAPLLLLAGCSPDPNIEVVGGAPTAVPDNESTYKDFGDYVLYFNALSTDQLTPEVAKQFGIVRSKNRAMLNVSIIRKQEDTIGVSTPGSVSASARNLTGQLKNLTVRENPRG